MSLFVDSKSTLSKITTQDKLDTALYLICFYSIYDFKHTYIYFLNKSILLAERSFGGFSLLLLFHNYYT